MGFGLRKEVYTRKPKKAFNKARELYKEEALNRSSDHVLQDPHELKERIRKKLKKNIRKEYLIRILALTFLIIFLTLSVRIIQSIFNYTKKDRKYADKSALFKTIIYNQEIWVGCKNGLLQARTKGCGNISKGRIKTSELGELL